MKPLYNLPVIWDMTLVERNLISPFGNSVKLTFNQYNSFACGNILMLEQDPSIALLAACTDLLLDNSVNISFFQRLLIVKIFDIFFQHAL